MDTCLELFSEQSFEAISKANRKAYNTTRYWIDRIFMALKGTQDGIILSGKVYLDETYLKVITRAWQALAEICIQWIQGSYGTRLDIDP